MRMWYAGCSVLHFMERHHHGFSTLPQGQSLLGNSFKLHLSHNPTMIKNQGPCS